MATLCNCVGVALAAPLSPGRASGRELLPIRTGYEAPRAWDSSGTLKTTRSSDGSRRTGARWMRTRSQQKVDLKCCSDASESLEANAFSQSVLDHGQDALAHATNLAQVGLGREPKQANVAQLVAEMEDDVFDRDWLLSEVVRHAVYKQPALIPGLTEPSQAWRRDRRLDRRNSDGTTPTRPPYRPREIVTRLNPARSVAGGASRRTRYNRRLTCRGTAQPTNAARPGGPIA